LLTLVATVAASSMAFFDATVVVVALPTIERDLDLGLTGEQWVVLSYSLALASLYLVGGALGDRYGRRRVFAAATVGFAVASALAGAAPTPEILIAARTLQGIAGAVLTPTSLGLLRATFGRESGRAIGLWSSWTAVATIAGPPAGGALVEWVSWRFVFFVNLPLAGVTVALALAGGRDERPHDGGRLDIPGAVLAALAFAALTFGLVEAGRDGFDAPAAWTALAAATVAIVAFLAFERRTAEPMLPLDLFRRRNFSVGNAETFLVYAALNAAMFYLALYLQTVGFSPFEAGWLLAPASVILVLLAARFGRVADRRGPRVLLTAGPALIGGGTLLFVLLGREPEWSRVLPGVLVFGLGLALTVAPITATVLRSAPDRYSGVAAGVNSTISRLGGLVAIALVGLVIASAYDGPGQPLAKDQGGEAARASLDAFRTGMLATGALAFAGAAIGLAGLSDREYREG
jgi:EmrB/QacA subfamily drug resistance transporter